MQFFTVASALFAAALAAPAPQTTDCPNPAHCGGSPPNPDSYENIDITDFSLRKNDGIQSVSFKLSGRNATDLDCESGPVGTVPTQTTYCGSSKYNWAITKADTSDYGIVIYHETGPSVGVWGSGDIPTYCRAGGNGPNDFVCSQVSPVTIVITGSG